MQTIKAIITGEKSFVGKNLVKFFKKKKNLLQYLL